MATEEMVKDFEAALAPETPSVPQESAPAAPPTPSVEELEILLGGRPTRIPVNAEIPVKHNGQILKTPLEKLLNSFRQSTHLEDRIKEYKSLKDETEKLRGDVTTFQDLQKKYGAIQSWSEQNPQEWERLWELYQNKDRALMEPQTEGADPKLSRVYDELASAKQQLEELRGWKSEFDKEREQARIAQDVETVKADIDQFSKDWPEIDLNEKNLDGDSLRTIIMNHGVKRGIPEFRLAALDYLGPRLTDIAIQRGRSEAVKGLQKDTQQGIVARSSTPIGGQGSEIDPSKMTKAERLAAARAEYERSTSEGT